MRITEGLGQGLIYFFTRIPLIGDAMAAFLALGLVLAAIAIGFQYKNRTLEQLDIPRRTFCRWYDRYLEGGPEALADRPSAPNRARGSWSRCSKAPYRACVASIRS